MLRRGRPDCIGGGIAGLLLALIRIEGVAWAAVILVLATVSRRIARQRAFGPLLTFALIVGIGYGVYFTWRYSYYQMLLPNTAYAKADLDVARLLRGLNYVISHLLAFVTPILIVPGSLLALRKEAAIHRAAGGGDGVGLPGLRDTGDRRFHDDGPLSGPGVRV